MPELLDTVVLSGGLEVSSAGFRATELVVSL